MTNDQPPKDSVIRHSPALYSTAFFKLGFVCAQLLPRRLTHWLAPRIALAVYRRKPSVQAILRANLQRVTGLDARALDVVCAENVAHFGRMLADYFLCAGLDSGHRASLLLDEWRGREYLAAARTHGHGVIVVTAHLGHWELGGILLAQLSLPMTVVTLDEPSTELTRWRDAFRRHLGIRTVAVGPGREFAFIELVHTLRRNECVAMLVDRPYAGSGTAVDFFGARAEFSTAPALLAHHTGAAVVPAFVLLNERDRYTAFADPPISMKREASARSGLAESTQRIATIFESIIRPHPEQWFNYVPIWTHDQAR